MAQLKAKVEKLSEAGVLAVRTRRAYASNWRSFSKWCEAANRRALPASPETVCLYLAAAGERLRWASLRMHLVAIRFQHEESGGKDPTSDRRVRRVLAGLMRRGLGSANRKTAITPAELRAMVNTLDRTKAHGARNAAILLLGFSSGLRRCDLIGLDLADLNFVPEGVVVSVRREKNDQIGKGRRIAVWPGHDETCPVRALNEWLDRRGRQPGPLFTRIVFSPVWVGKKETITLTRLDHQIVWRVVKIAAEKIGLDPALYGAHSLRAGMITACAENGESDTTIMQRSGHQSADMVARYRRHNNLFWHNPLAKAL